MTYYLKYRPHTIDELDLTDVRERLGRIVKQANFSHAYLFYGPRGTGKTSAARIVAKAARVATLDVIEMDAASHRGIDDVRELRERVGLSPMVGDRKAYIIDEVHMLTAEAFNALLKTLEEPPAHVIFFLCTTEMEKLPATIVSRCVKIPFSLATLDEITRSLKRIAVSEKFNASDEILNLISAAGNGSFRETQTLLQEAVATAKDRLGDSGKIEVILSDLEKITGKSVLAKVKNYVDALISGQAKPALSAIQNVVDTGANVFDFSRQILENLRSKLISPDTVNSDRILTVTKVVEEKIRTIRYAPIPQLPLEIAALELSCHPEKSATKDPANEESDQNISSASLDSSQTLRMTHMPKIASISFLEFNKSWPLVLSQSKSKNHGLSTLLSHCHPASIEDNTAFIDVKYKFHKEQLEQQKFKHLIEGILADTFGAKLRLRFQLNPQTSIILKKQPQDDNINAIEENDLEEVFKL